MSLEMVRNQITLADAVRFIVDNRGKSAPAEQTGIALIATNCVSNDNLYPEKLNVRYVSQDTYDNWFRSHPMPGDILLTNKGSQNGAVCLVPDPVDFCIAQDMVALRADKEIIDPLYLFAALRSSLVQRRIKDLNVDAVIPHFKKTDFDKLHIPIPSRAEQEYIGKIYFDLSNKIELNRQTNQTLEQIAQAIFKSWFVDFDPVKAKIAARAERRDPLRAAMGAISGKSDAELDQLPPESYDQLAATAALFPDEMEESELGEIPKGWEVTTLDQLTTKIGSGATPRGGRDVYLDEGVALIRSQNVYDSRFVWDGLARISDKAADKLRSVEVKRGDVLLNITGASILRTCVVDPEVLPARVNQHVAIIRAKQNISSKFIHLYLLQIKTKDFLSGLNAGGSREAVTKGHISCVPILDPRLGVMAAFERLVAPTVAEGEALSTQSRTLAALRDTLLPKLLSGELPVPPADDPE